MTENTYIFHKDLKNIHVEYDSRMKVAGKSLGPYLVLISEGLPDRAHHAMYSSSAEGVGKLVKEHKLHKTKILVDFLDDSKRKEITDVILTSRN